ncbi:MAG: hypothetical protein GY851_24575, partial [bacterium]|nr:hypothetical protein [bacterium]
MRISRDAGSTWATSFVSTRLASIYFVDARHGWAVGGAGKLSRTSDGGDNWIHTVLPTDEDFYAVHFVDQRIGWAAGGYVGHGLYGHGFPDGISIWSTTDGGASWRCSPRIAFGRAEPHAHPETIYGLVFRDRQEGWAVTHGMMKKSKPCEYGRVLRTT